MLMKRFIFASLLFLAAVNIASAKELISVSPEKIIQGDPIMVTIEGATSKASPVAELWPREITFAGQSIPTFLYKDKTRALIGIDLYKKSGDYELSFLNTDGKSIKKIITIGKREKLEAPLGIPKKLGGNTPAAATKLVTNLSAENKLLENIRTGTHAFWTKPFIYPVKNPVVTDTYGYSRKTGSYSIAHKGTDFRAALGTPVMAMNRGVVRVARTTTVYGKMIVVDHGLGLQTLYMHLSKIKVNEGELVQPGQVIGLSGATGYAEMPHLHLSVKMKGISIDPVRFMDFFKN